MEDLKKKKIKIAFIGKSGAGSSSLINALRGVTCKDEGAAEVGVVVTTLQPTKYPHPRNRIVEFWDLPGLDGRHGSVNSYSNMFQLDTYTMFVFVANEMITAIEIELLKKIKALGKQFLFVQTRIYYFLRYRMTSHTRSYDENTALATMRKESELKLQNAGIEALQLFLVDCSTTDRFDFVTLMKKIVTNAGDFFCELLFVQIRKELALKADTLKNTVWYFSLDVCATSGNNLMAVCSKRLQFYKAEFSLDDAGLSEEHQANISNICGALRSDNQLKKLLDCNFFEVTTKFRIATYWANMSINRIRDLAENINFMTMVSEFE